MKPSNIAKKIFTTYQDFASVLEAANIHCVESIQDYEAETSDFFFDDNSRLTLCGIDYSISVSG